MKTIKIIRYADNEDNTIKGRHYFCLIEDFFALTGSAAHRKNEKRTEYHIDENTLVWARSAEGFGRYVDYPKNKKIIDAGIGFGAVKTNEIPPKQNFVLVPLWLVAMRIETMLNYSKDKYVGYELTEIIL